MNLCSELRPHFSLASESDAPDQEDADVEDTETNSPQQRRPPAISSQDETVVTSGVSTLSSTVSHESRNGQHSVSMELGRMKLETNRLQICRDRKRQLNGLQRSILMFPLTCVTSGCWSSFWRKSENIRPSFNKFWRRESRRSDYYDCDLTLQVDKFSVSIQRCTFVIFFIWVSGKLDYTVSRPKSGHTGEKKWTHGKKKNNSLDKVTVFDKRFFGLSLSPISSKHLYVDV